MSKVFGLGLSKTGTSSLAEALNRLGIRTVHYPCDEPTFEHLRNGRYRLPVLEEHQGAVDIPVAPFFAQLDAEYPGSRFVLTVREPEAWLRSVELHWELMMDWWHQYPDFKRFQEFISLRAYGAAGFSRERFLQAYETHRRNVERYFRDRPRDLLVLDVCGGEGGEALCPFLGVEIPDAPFPHANEWMHQLLAATAELAMVVPLGESMVLVDQDAFGRGVAAGRGGGPLPGGGGGVRGAARGRRAGGGRADPPDRRGSPVRRRRLAGVLVARALSGARRPSPRAFHPRARHRPPQGVRDRAIQARL